MGCFPGLKNDLIWMSCRFMFFVIAACWNSSLYYKTFLCIHPCSPGTFMQDGVPETPSILQRTLVHQRLYSCYKIIQWEKQDFNRWDTTYESIDQKGAKWCWYLDSENTDFWRKLLKISMWEQPSSNISMFFMSVFSSLD